MGMGGMGGFQRQGSSFQMPQRFGAPQRGMGGMGGGMDPRLNYTGMSREQTLGRYGMNQGIQQMGRNPGAPSFMPQTSGLHPGMGVPKPFMPNSSPPPQPTMPTPMEQAGPAIGDPAGVFGFPRRPPVPMGQPPAISDPPGAFGFPRPMPTYSGGGYGTQGNTNGMTGIQDPGVGGSPVGPQGGGARSMQSATDMFGQGGATAWRNQGNPAIQKWNGGDELRLSEGAGAIDWDPSLMQSLGHNGSSFTLTQDYHGNPVGAAAGGSGYSDNARFWISGPGGENLGSLDQLGKTNNLRAMNIPAGAKLNWSGVGKNGALLKTNSANVAPGMEWMWGRR